MGNAYRTTLMFSNKKKNSHPEVAIIYARAKLVLKS
jgi:hypothetical protein